MENMREIEFVQTCPACPEQYDVYIDKIWVGYIRLRWGWLSCRYGINGRNPIKGKCLIVHRFDDGYKGCFEVGERREWLYKCKMALLKRYEKDLKRKKRLRKNVVQSFV